MEQILTDIRGQFLQNAKSSYYKQLMKDYKVNQIDIPLFCQINKINRISFPIRNENCKNIQCIFQDDSIIQAYKDQKNDNNLRCPNCSQELIKEQYFLDLSLEQLIYKYSKNQKTEYLSSDHIRIQRHGNEYEKMMVTLTINSDMNEYVNLYKSIDQLITQFKEMVDKQIQDKGQNHKIQMNLFQLNEALQTSLNNGIELQKDQSLKRNGFLIARNTLNMVGQEGSLRLYIPNSPEENRDTLLRVIYFDEINEKFIKYPIDFMQSTVSVNKNLGVLIIGGISPQDLHKSCDHIYLIDLNYIINKTVIARKSQQLKLLKARQQHKVLRVDNKIIVVGGGYTENQEDFQYIPECELIDLEKKQVQYLPPLNYPRLNCSLAQNQNKQIFCFGGYLKNEINCPYIEYLNLQNPTQWMVLQDPNYKPFSDSLIVDIRDNQFIIFGGTQIQNERGGKSHVEQKNVQFFDYQKNQIIQSKNFDMTYDESFQDGDFYIRKNLVFCNNKSSSKFRVYEYDRLNNKINQINV